LIKIPVIAVGIFQMLDVLNDSFASISARYTIKFKGLIWYCYSQWTL